MSGNSGNVKPLNPVTRRIQVSCLSCVSAFVVTFQVDQDSRDDVTCCPFCGSIDLAEIRRDDTPVILQ